MVTLITLYFAVLIAAIGVVGRSLAPPAVRTLGAGLRPSREG